MANLFESVQLGSLVLANRVFMAPLTRSRANADRYSERTRGDLLLTARLGWTHRDRGDANLAHGKGLHKYSRDSFAPTGASVESYRGIRSQERRPNLSSVVACRQNLPYVLAAEQCAASSSLGNSRQQPNVHRNRSSASLGAGRLDTGGHQRNIIRLPSSCL